MDPDSTGSSVEHNINKTSDGRINNKTESNDHFEFLDELFMDIKSAEVTSCAEDSHPSNIDFQEEVESLTNMLEPKPECSGQNAMNGHTPSIEVLSSENEKLKKTVKELAERNAINEEELKNCDSRLTECLKEFLSRKTETDDFKEIYSKFQKERASLLTKVEQLESELNQYKQLDLKKWADAEEIAALKKDLTTKTKNVQKLKNEVNQLTEKNNCLRKLKYFHKKTWNLMVQFEQNLQEAGLLTTKQKKALKKLAASHAEDKWDYEESDKEDDTLNVECNHQGSEEMHVEKPKDSERITGKDVCANDIAKNSKCAQKQMASFDNTLTVLTRGQEGKQAFVTDKRPNNVGFVSPLKQKQSRPCSSNYFLQSHRDMIEDPHISDDCLDISVTELNELKDQLCMPNEQFTPISPIPPSPPPKNVRSVKVRSNSKLLKKYNYNNLGTSIMNSNNNNMDGQEQTTCHTTSNIEQQAESSAENSVKRNIFCHQQSEGFEVQNEASVILDNLSSVSHGSNTFEMPVDANIVEKGKCQLFGKRFHDGTVRFKFSIANPINLELNLNNLDVSCSFGPFGELKQNVSVSNPNVQESFASSLVSENTYENASNKCAQATEPPANIKQEDIESRPDFKIPLVEGKAMKNLRNGFSTVVGNIDSAKHAKYFKGDDSNSTTITTFSQLSDSGSHSTQVKLDRNHAPKQKLSNLVQRSEHKNFQTIEHYSENNKSIVSSSCDSLSPLKKNLVSACPESFVKTPSTSPKTSTERQYQQISDVVKHEDSTVMSYSSNNSNEKSFSDLIKEDANSYGSKNGEEFSHCVHSNSSFKILTKGIADPNSGANLIKCQDISGLARASTKSNVLEQKNETIMEKSSCSFAVEEREKNVVDMNFGEEQAGLESVDVMESKIDSLNERASNGVGIAGFSGMNSLAINHQSPKAASDQTFCVSEDEIVHTVNSKLKDAVPSKKQEVSVSKKKFDKKAKQSKKVGKVNVNESNTVQPHSDDNAALKKVIKKGRRKKSKLALENHSVETLHLNNSLRGNNLVKNNVSNQHDNKSDQNADGEIVTSVFQKMENSLPLHNKKLTAKSRKRAGRTSCKSKNDKLEINGIFLELETTNTNCVESKANATSAIVNMNAAKIDDVEYNQASFMDNFTLNDDMLCKDFVLPSAPSFSVTENDDSGNKSCGIEGNHLNEDSIKNCNFKNKPVKLGNFENNGVILNESDKSAHEDDENITDSIDASHIIVNEFPADQSISKSESVISKTDNLTENSVFANESSVIKFASLGEGGASNTNPKDISEVACNNNSPVTNSLGIVNPCVENGKEFVPGSCENSDNEKQKGLNDEDIRTSDEDGTLVIAEDDLNGEFHSNNDSEICDHTGVLPKTSSKKEEKIELEAGRLPPKKRKKTKNTYNKAKKRKVPSSQPTQPEEKNSNHPLYETFEALEKLKYNDAHSKRHIHNLVNVLINPKIVSDISSLIYHMLCYLSTSTRNPCLSFSLHKDPKVLLPDIEKVIITSLIQVEKKMKQHLQGLLASTISTFHLIVLAQENLSVFSLSSLCRVLTGICQSTSDSKKALVLCCDLLKMKHKYAPYLIASIVGVWKEIFQISKESSDEDVIFQGSIVYAVEEKPESLSENQWKQCRVLLTEYLNALPVTNVDKISDFLIKAIKNNCNENYPDEYKLTSPLVIFASREGWDWAEENLLNKYIIPSMLEFSKDLNNKKAFAIFCELFCDICMYSPDIEDINLLYSFYAQDTDGNEVYPYVRNIAAGMLVKFYMLKGLEVPDYLTVWVGENEQSLNETDTELAVRRRLIKDDKGFSPDHILLWHM